MEKIMLQVNTDRSIIMWMFGSTIWLTSTDILGKSGNVCD